MGRRASKLIPFLSVYDPPYVEITDPLSWPSACAPIESQRNEQSEKTQDPGCQEKIHNDSPESSTLSQQSTSDASSTRSRKRQRDSAEDPALKRGRLVPVQKSASRGVRAGRHEHSHSVDPPWDKSVLIRLQLAPEQAIEDIRHTFVKLPALDADSCAAAICAKMDISFTKGMSVSWVDSKTSLRGPFDHAFLRSMSDMQDFVISITRMGVDGNIGILLEM